MRISYSEIGRAEFGQARLVYVTERDTYCSNPQVKRHNLRSKYSMIETANVNTGGKKMRNAGRVVSLQVDVIDVTKRYLNRMFVEERRYENQSLETWSGISSVVFMMLRSPSFTTLGVTSVSKVRNLARFCGHL